MNNILLWGGKSRALIIHNYLENINSLNKKFLIVWLMFLLVKIITVINNNKKINAVDIIKFIF